MASSQSGLGHTDLRSLVQFEGIVSKDSCCEASNHRLQEIGGGRLRNAAALHSYGPRFLVEKPVSLVMAVANTEDIEIRVTNGIFVFLEELSTDLSIPCRDVDVFVSIKGLAIFLILRITLGRILC